MPVPSLKLLCLSKIYELSHDYTEFYQSILFGIDDTDEEANLIGFIKQINLYSDYNWIHFLVTTLLGFEILEKDPRLMILITHNLRLNYIEEFGQLAGESLAFWFSKTNPGIDKLIADDYVLADLIQPDTFNAIIPQGPNQGFSIAFNLAISTHGR